MTLDEIKDQLGIPQFHLNTAVDKDGNPTEWMRHWDNTRRIAVSFPKDLASELASGKNPNLGLQEETRSGDKGEYTAFRVVAYTPAEMSI